MRFGENDHRAKFIVLGLKVGAVNISLFKIAILSVDETFLMGEEGSNFLFKTS